MSTFESMPGCNLWTVSYEVDSQPPWETTIPQGSREPTPEEITTDELPFVRLIMQYVPRDVATRQSAKVKDRMIKHFRKHALEQLPGSSAPSSCNLYRPACNQLPCVKCL